MSHDIKSKLRIQGQQELRQPVGVLVCLEDDQSLVVLIVLESPVKAI